MTEELLSKVQQRPRDIKIAYIGGGSKQWARVFMYDLALCPDLTGEIGLFDLDVPAASRKQQIMSFMIRWNPVWMEQIL